jgi:hypothetical protein
LNIYGEYDHLLGCLQVRYTDAMAMAMAMMIICSERKPPSMPPSQDEAHTTIGDFTEITVSNSDNDLHLVRVTSARLDGRMPDIPEVEIWRTVSLWMFLDSLLFSLLHYFFGSRPSTNGVGTGFYHLMIPVKWRWSFPRAPNPPKGHPERY